MTEKRAPYNAMPRSGDDTVIFHEIERPWAPGVVQVYGDPDNAWYEWRLLDGSGAVERDSADVGQHGMGYGNTRIALRDALIADTD